MPTRTATGTEISAQIATCSAVPTIAWRTPPPEMSLAMPDWSVVHQSAWKMTLAPLLMTVHNSQKSGMSAAPNAAVTSTVARLFLTLRAPRALANVGDATVAVIRGPRRIVERQRSDSVG